MFFVVFFTVPIDFCFSVENHGGGPAEGALGRVRQELLHQIRLRGLRVRTMQPDDEGKS